MSTLHSFARRLLSENPAVLGNRRFRFLLQFEEDALLYDIASELEEPGDLPSRRRLLHRTQSSRSNRTDLPDARFAGAVDRWLQSHGGMLVGDLVPLAVDGLEAGDIPRGQFDQVIIDEYQDLTAAEQHMVELIWSGEGSLVVLGDDDQSIYKFRFNHPGGITEFAGRMREHGLDVLEIPILENRRCGVSIVELANLMMAAAGSTKEPMVPAREDVGSAVPVYWDSVEDEVTGLARYMRSDEEKRFLVLVPRRFIGHRLADAIGEDARTSFHQQVLQLPVTQERFALGMLLANPDDAVALRAWFGFRGDHPEPHASRNAAAYASVVTDELSPSELVTAIAEGEVTPRGEGQSNIVRRSQRLLQFQAERPQGLRDAIEFIFDPRHARAVEEGERRQRAEHDLGLLRRAALELAEAADEEVTLQQILEQLAYRIATRAPLADDPDDPRVKIMTLHSAKGLEADAIVLAGIADQIIPGYATGADREEQRRLLYVAITRARQELIVSWGQSVAYADAAAEAIRIDDVFTQAGQRRVALSRSQLLPAGLPAPTHGPEWLAASGL